MINKMHRYTLSSYLNLLCFNVLFCILGDLIYNKAFDKLGNSNYNDKLNNAKLDKWLVNPECNVSQW